MLESVTVSNSRTYVVVMYDVASPDEVRFAKVELPEPFKNNSNQAKNYYLFNNAEPATRILACVAFEDYISAFNEVFEKKEI